MKDDQIRTNWTQEEVKEIFYMPFLELVYRAATVHRKFHEPNSIQKCTLLSVKTGGCPENCAYCPQSAHYETKLDRIDLLSLNEIQKAAFEAKASGSTRFCMGAAWRQVKDGPEFDRILEAVHEVAGLGMEVCCTLGMLNPDQAKRLKEAGLTAYNHNIDTSPEFYEKIISTRKFEDRLKTLDAIRASDLQTCCGGIIGMGESEKDRIDFLWTLSTFAKHPESVPINLLVPVEGTPLEKQNEVKVSIFDFVRVIATARILMPASRVRLSAGRLFWTDAEQALCFLAGANSIFSGEKLLTTPNNSSSDDLSLLNQLNLKSHAYL